MLAALGAANADRPTLVVKVDARTISIAILDKNQLLLFRTLETPAAYRLPESSWQKKFIPRWSFSRIRTT